MSLTVTGGRRYDRRGMKAGYPRQTYRPSSYLDITQLNQFKQTTDSEITSTGISELVDWLGSIN